MWLKDSGYETGLVGKYINKYRRPKGEIPAGWTEWYGANTPNKGWTLNENGTIRTYQQDSTSPSYKPWENVLGDKAIQFVGDAHASGGRSSYGTAPTPRTPPSSSPRETRTGGAPGPPTTRRASTSATSRTSHGG